MKSNIFITATFLILLASCGNRQPYQTIETSYDDEYLEEMESYENDIRDGDGISSLEKDKMQIYIENEAVDISGFRARDQENRAEGFLTDDFQGNTTKAHEFKDARTGLTVHSSEYPAEWQVISRPTYTLDQKIPVFLIQIQGPDNLKTFNTPLKVHLSYHNPQTYQLMAQSTLASMHRPLISNRQIIEEEVSARMQKSGFSYIKDLEMPKTKNYLNQKITKAGSNVQLDLLTTIWGNNTGQKALISVGKILMQQPLSSVDMMTMWLYSVGYVFVDAPKFNETITKLENALLSTKENTEWQQYMNQLFQQRTKVAARQHQQKMTSRQAAFNAHQEKMKGISAAQDANHASFMNRNFGVGSSTSQNNFLNMINEQETVYNPLNGKNYQVQAGSMEYWMDSDGKHIENNDLFYTPNGDINLNNREWVKVRGEY